MPCRYYDEDLRSCQRKLSSYAAGWAYNDTMVSPWPNLRSCTECVSYPPMRSKRSAKPRLDSKEARPRTSPCISLKAERKRFARSSNSRWTLSSSFIRRFRLLLRGHLRVGIPPGTQLQPAAHPAEPFGRIRGALAFAYRAPHRLPQAIRLNCPLGFFQKLFRHDGVHNQGLRHRPGCGDALALHNPTITASRTLEL